MTTRFFLFGFLLLPFFSVAQVVDTARVHVEVDSLVQLNRKLVGESKFEEALQVIEMADSMANVVFGGNNALHAECLFYHGRTYYFMGDYGKAEPLYLESLDMREKVLGKEHSNYVESLNNLAALYLDDEKYQKAETFYLEVLNTREKVLGKENSDYSNSLNDLGILYYYTGEYDKAEHKFLESLAIREKVLGKEHSDYVWSLNNLALIYSNKEEYDKAEPLYLEALTIRGKMVGKQHPDYAACLLNLAGLYAANGKYESAELLYLETKDILEKTLGKVHPDYARCLNNLAILYHYKGEYDNVEPLYLESLTIREKALGKEHPEYARNLNNLATLYCIKGEYDKAEQLFFEALTIQERVLGKQKPDYARSLNNLANLYLDQGDYYKAEALSLESLAILKKVLGKDDPECAGSLNTLATLYSIKGEYDKAELLMLEHKSIIEKVVGKEHPEYALSLNNLSMLYSAQGDLDNAKLMILESLAIKEKVLGKEHPDYALSLNNLAALYNDNAEHDKAEPLFVEALTIRERVFGKEHPDYAQSLINLATHYENKGDFNRAEHLYLEAKAIQEKAMGKEHPNYAENLNNLAHLYRDITQPKISEPYFTEASSITKRFLQKSAAYTSSQELEKLIALYQDKNDAFYSFNHQTTSDSFRIASYNNALFYKGFALEMAIRLDQAMRSAPDSIRDIHSRWKGYNRLLAAELALPIAERTNAVYLDSMSNVLEKVLLRAAPAFEVARRQIVWQGVSDALRSSEAAIEFIHYHYSAKKDMDSTMYSALVTIPGGKAPQFIPLCEARQLDALVYKSDGIRANYLQNLYASPRKDGLPTLHQLLWSPLDKLLREQGVKTVYYAPTGLLHRLNLSAIAEGKSGARLADTYKFVPMGSTRQLSVSQSVERPIQLNGALIYGGVHYEMDSSAITIANASLNATAQDTTGGLFGFAYQTEAQRGENWDYLPGSEKEARYLDSLLRHQGINTTLRLGYQATEESFKQIGQNGPSPSLLHIGTHGFFFPDPQDTSRRRATLSGDEPVFKISEYSMIRSGLKFAGSKYAWKNGHPLPGGHEDGILTAYEVSQMNLSNTQLVVLSACETGLGDIRGNEGVYGLQRAFRIAGAKNVLMSLWKVPDDATEKLMTRFYSNWLAEKKPLRESFEEAQKWLRGQKGLENPYYWAGFVLVGEL